MRWMDRWAAHAQRKSDERAARWARRQHEKARTGRTTFMDRWAVRAQRKSDEAAARWREVDPIDQLLASGPVRGPLGSTAVIRVYPTAWPWRGTVVSSGGGGGAYVLAFLLIIAAIRFLIFRRSRSWTVYARYDGYPPRTRVRLASQQAAYRAATELVGRFQAEGPTALESWQADVTASIPRHLA